MGNKRSYKKVQREKKSEKIDKIISVDKKPKKYIVDTDKTKKENNSLHTQLLGEIHLL